MSKPSKTTRLVITRKAGEGFTMTSGALTIRITLTEERKSGRVRLAIEAPEHVRIARNECVPQIQPVNQ